MSSLLQFCTGRQDNANEDKRKGEDAKKRPGQTGQDRQFHCISPLVVTWVPNLEIELGPKYFWRKYCLNFHLVKIFRFLRNVPQIQNQSLRNFREIVKLKMCVGQPYSCKFPINGIISASLVFSPQRPLSLHLLLIIYNFSFVLYFLTKIFKGLCHKTH